MDSNVSTYPHPEDGQVEDPAGVQQLKNPLLMKMILTGDSGTTVILSCTLQIRTQLKRFAKSNTSNTSPMSPASLILPFKNKYFSELTKSDMHEIHGCDMKKLQTFRNNNFSVQCRTSRGSCPYWRESWEPKALKQ